jgi:hypothetical protein
MPNIKALVKVKKKTSKRLALIHHWKRWLYEKPWSFGSWSRIMEPHAYYNPSHVSISDQEEEELRVQGPSMNEVSFRARPHHSMHRTLGSDQSKSNTCRMLNSCQ